MDCFQSITSSTLLTIDSGKTLTLNPHYTLENPRLPKSCMAGGYCGPKHQPLLLIASQAKISETYSYFIILNLEKSEDAKFFNSYGDNVKIIFEAILLERYFVLLFTFYSDINTFIKCIHYSNKLIYFYLRIFILFNSVSKIYILIIKNESSMVICTYNKMIKIIF